MSQTACNKCLVDGAESVPSGMIAARDARDVNTKHARVRHDFATLDLRILIRRQTDRADNKKVDRR